MHFQRHFHDFIQNFELSSELSLYLCLDFKNHEYDNHLH